MFASTLARVESAFAALTGRKRERPSQESLEATSTAAPIPAPIAVPEEPLPTPPAAAALGSPGSAFVRVTEDWSAARAAAAQSSVRSASDDAAYDAHFAKRRRAMRLQYVTTRQTEPQPSDSDQ